MTEEEKKRRRGRAWVPMLWMEGRDAGENKERILNPPWADSPSTGVFSFDRDFEYRMVYDHTRQFWRLDARKHVPGH